MIQKQLILILEKSISLWVSNKLIGIARKSILVLTGHEIKKRLPTPLFFPACVTKLARSCCGLQKRDEFVLLCERVASVECHPQ